MRDGQRAESKGQRAESMGQRVSIADFGLRPGGALGHYAPEGLWISDWMNSEQRAESREQRVEGLRRSTFGVRHQVNGKRKIFGRIFLAQPLEVTI